MKIQELFEAVKKDYSSVIDQLEQTKEFKNFSKKFDLVSTPIQRRNGSLAIFTKKDILKSRREFFVNAKGVVKVKNEYASIFATLGKGIGDEGSLSLYLDVIQKIETTFDEWLEKRKKSATKNGSDVSNLSLRSLVPLNISDKIVNEFNCSNNHLTSLEGAPKLYDATGIFNCSKNELVSPLTNTPEKCNLFFVSNNKLTTFEGFPKEANWMHLFGNDFITYRGIEKNIHRCPGFHVDFSNKNGKPYGMLSFFKIKDCKQLELPSSVKASEKDNKAQEIINKYLALGTQDMLGCQDELIDNGLSEYAKL